VLRGEMVMPGASARGVVVSQLVDPVVVFELSVATNFAATFLVFGSEVSPLASGGPRSMLAGTLRSQGPFCLCGVAGFVGSSVGGPVSSPYLRAKGGISVSPGAAPFFRGVDAVGTAGVCFRPTSSLMSVADFLFLFSLGDGGGRYSFIVNHSTGIPVGLMSDAADPTLGVTSARGRWTIFDAGSLLVDGGGSLGVAFAVWSSWACGAFSILSRDLNVKWGCTALFY
jgi:hypothetical protein